MSEAIYHHTHLCLLVLNYNDKCNHPSLHAHKVLVNNIHTN